MAYFDPTIMKSCLLDLISDRWVRDYAEPEDVEITQLSDTSYRADCYFENGHYYERDFPVSVTILFYDIEDVSIDFPEDDYPVYRTKVKIEDISVPGVPYDDTEVGRLFGDVGAYAENVTKLAKFGDEIGRSLYQAKRNDTGGYIYYFYH